MTLKCHDNALIIVFMIKFITCIRPTKPAAEVKIDTGAGKIITHFEKKSLKKLSKKKSLYG